jgi:hypothetical protein
MLQLYFDIMSSKLLGLIEKCLWLFNLKSVKQNSVHKCLLVCIIFSAMCCCSVIWWVLLRRL